MDHQITDYRNSIKFLGNMLGVLLSDFKRYLLLYESILSELDHFLDAPGQPVQQPIVPLSGIC